MMLAFLAAALLDEPGPSADWKIEESANRCAITRSLDVPRLAAISVSRDTMSGRVEMVSLRTFDEVLPESPVPDYQRTGLDGMARAFRPQVDGKGFALWGKGRDWSPIVILWQGERYTIDLPPPPMLQALAECDDRKLSALFGMPVMTRLIATPAVERVTARSMTSDSDYPARALRDGEHGKVTVRSLVGVDGAVEDCRVERSSGFAALDEASCRMVRRARYDPALNAAGKPMRAVNVHRFDWRLAN